jgi:hypothetical protein
MAIASAHQLWDQIAESYREHEVQGGIDLPMGGKGRGPVYGHELERRQGNRRSDGQVHVTRGIYTKGTVQERIADRGNYAEDESDQSPLARERKQTTVMVVDQAPTAATVIALTTATAAPAINPFFNISKLNISIFTSSCGSMPAKQLTTPGVILPCSCVDGSNAYRRLKNVGFFTVAVEVLQWVEELAPLG